MRYILLCSTLCFALAGCDSGAVKPNGTPTGSPDLSSAPPADLAQGTASAADLALTSAPVDGAAGVCPPTMGNSKGIGTPCTKGGSQCPSGLLCDKDLNDQGVGMCISLGSCSPGHGDCGAGASCCKTAMTQNFPVCLPNPCVPAGCTIE
jgi:hypothetical protein